MMSHPGRILGVPSNERAAIGEDALRQACVTQLGHIFGEKAAKPGMTLLKDWAADPLTSTSPDLTLGGHPIATEESWVNAPWAARLHLAGSETSKREPGHLAGAVDAA